LPKKVIINGPTKLNGEVNISGAKNAALPILAASILLEGDSTIDNIPDLTDIITMVRMLKTLNINAEFHNNTVRIINTGKVRHIVPYELITKMRASFFVAGPILAKTGLVKIPLPGGCAIGSRPVDIHLKGFKALGAKITLEHGFIIIQADRLKGSDIYLDFPSVGATENIMMAASLADGETCIRNAAREPEIVDLAQFLNKGGAQISGAGSTEITIKGVSSLGAVNHAIIPDRVETGTFLLAAAMTGGQVTTNKTNPTLLMALIQELKKIGLDVSYTNDSITVAVNGPLKAVDIDTSPYPGFPTDMQPQMASLLTLAKGTSVISEKIFENRFIYTAELQRMGANIKVKDNLVIIEGVDKLSGAFVASPDLRAGAALWMAAMAAEGQSTIDYNEHVYRGYENFSDKLRLLGADIQDI